jgi:hypothetical protein
MIKGNALSCRVAEVKIRREETRINKVPIGLVGVIAVVLLISLTTLLIPSGAVYANGRLTGSSPINAWQPRAASAILSVSSGSAGTMVTVTTPIPSEISAHGVAAYENRGNQYGPEYFIYFQQASGSKLPTITPVASGDLSCNTLLCTGNNSAVNLKSGSFSVTFPVPRLSPGTYNVIVNIEYLSPVGAYYSESATAIFTVT